MMTLGLSQNNYFIAELRGIIGQLKEDLISPCAEYKICHDRNDDYNKIHSLESG